jgi:hypothetical protein
LFNATPTPVRLITPELPPSVALLRVMVNDPVLVCHVVGLNCTVTARYPLGDMLKAPTSLGVIV